MRSVNSILYAEAHNVGYYPTSDNARMRSKPRRSRGVAEAKPRRSRVEISPASILSESRNYPNCVHWRICYFMWIRRICEFFCVHWNPILYTQNLPIESSVIENYAIDTRRTQYNSKYSIPNRRERFVG